MFPRIGEVSGIQVTVSKIERDANIGKQLTEHETAQAVI